MPFLGSKEIAKILFCCICCIQDETPINSPQTKPLNQPTIETRRPVLNYVSIQEKTEEESIESNSQRSTESITEWLKEVNNSRYSHDSTKHARWATSAQPTPYEKLRF